MRPHPFASTPRQLAQYLRRQFSDDWYTDFKVGRSGIFWPEVLRQIRENNELDWLEQCGSPPWALGR